jgi:hypothetical protein
MQKPEPRFMHPSDWTEAMIAQHRYFNRECAITGYESVAGQGDKSLHPACVFEDGLRETHRRFREAYTGVIASKAPDGRHQTAGGHTLSGFSAVQRPTVCGRLQRF